MPKYYGFHLFCDFQSLDTAGFPAQKGDGVFWHIKMLCQKFDEGRVGLAFIGGRSDGYAQIFFPGIIRFPSVDGILPCRGCDFNDDTHNKTYFPCFSGYSGVNTRREYDTK